MKNILSTQALLYTDSQSVKIIFLISFHIRFRKKYSLLIYTLRASFFFRRKINFKLGKSINEKQVVDNLHTFTRCCEVFQVCREYIGGNVQSSYQQIYTKTRQEQSERRGVRRMKNARESEAGHKTFMSESLYTHPR